MAAVGPPGEAMDISLGVFWRSLKGEEYTWPESTETVEK